MPRAGLDAPSAANAGQGKRSAGRQATRAGLRSD
jgi:hypothetical protein